MEVDISLGLKKQFQKQLKLIQRGDEYFLDPAVGIGKGMRYLEFPGKMEFYHFKKAKFHQPLNMTSINPEDSEWLMLHINLSNTKQNKVVSGENIELHKFLPIGILLYGPGLEITTQIPANLETEVVSIRFHHSFLDNYFNNWKEIIDLGKNLTYDDLDTQLENKLIQSLSSMDNMMDCHAKVLDFLNCYFNKLKYHQKETTYSKLHSKDLNNLLLASTHLRNPLAKTTPSLKQLASIANMGTTKFKTSFKQLFGSAPIQYRNKIRMEYAKIEIQLNHKSPTEVSYLLGYSHPSNFTVAYKQHFEKLPSSEKN